MNDKIIINTISKIYFITVSFLSLIFIGFSALFLVLQNGLYIDSISVPNVQIKKLYIKWDEKLHISIDETKITTDMSDSDLNFDYKKINGFFTNLAVFDDIFEKIVLEKFAINDVHGSFKYVYGDHGFLVASSKNFMLKSSIYSTQNILNIEINEYKDFKRDVDLYGNVVLDGKSLEITSELNVYINGDVSFDVFINANREKLFYSIKQLKDITKLEHLVSLFNLDKGTQYWALGAIKMKNLSIYNAYGWIEFKNIKDSYKNIYINAKANKLNYTYDLELDPIKTKSTDLIFKNGILYIYPKNAYTYGFYLNNSWVKLDFSKPEIYLTINLSFKGKLNNDILNILRTYDIELPLIQNKGTVHTNLNIEINLQTEEAKVIGDFFTKKANITYLGLDIDVFDTYITLDNYKLKINEMLAKYEDLITTKVGLNFDTNTSIGKVDFKVLDVSFKDADLNLQSNKKPLSIVYNISGVNNNIIDVESSTWKFGPKMIDIDEMSIDLDLDRLRLNIPKTLANTKGLMRSHVSGEVLLEPLKANIDINIIKLLHKDVKLLDSSIPLKLLYHDKFTILWTKDINLNYNADEYTLHGSKIEIKNSILDVKYSALNIKDILETKFNGLYSFENKNGTFNLENLYIKNNKLGEIFSNSNSSELHIKSNDENVTIKSKEFNVDYVMTDNKWELNLNSLSNLAKKSNILNDYNLTNGNVSIYKHDNDKEIQFSSNVIYPYRVLVKDEEPLQKYIIRGTYNDTTLFNINNSVDVSIDDNISISMNNTGININSILEFINDRDSNSTGDTPNIILNAKDSYLFIAKKRHIISDTINLQYSNNVTTAQLKYKNAYADFNLSNNKLNIYGEEFNHEFMENLFALSKFRNGTLSFSIHGTTKEYDGIFYVHNTTIVDYKVLNNVLAFVNTIPSLMTFSLPGYSSKGLYVNYAYMNFHSKNDIFNISDIYLNSKELDILGRGTANFETNTINLKLNLNTDLGSSISKIPIVGYILLGEDTVSTTLSITGALDDPKVKSLIAEDIIVAPLNILKRTFLLPVHIFRDK